MQYEYDTAVEELKTGREGLAQYRALVERVSRQIINDKAHNSNLNAKIKAYLQAGDRESASGFALELKKSIEQQAENEGQLQMHEQSYENHLMKIKHAGKKLSELREKIAKYDAELKMSRAEAEMAELANSFNLDVTTDFGQIEQMVQDKISLNRAKARVATDLSGDGVEDLKREQVIEKTLAENALKDFEMGLLTAQVVDPQRLESPSES